MWVAAYLPMKRKNGISDITFQYIRGVEVLISDYLKFFQEEKAESAFKWLKSQTKREALMKSRCVNVRVNQ